MSMSYEDFQRTFGWRNEEILRELFGPHISDQRVAELGDRKEELYWGSGFAGRCEGGGCK